MGYLDNAGLAHLWGKVKTALSKCVKFGANTLNAPLEFTMAASDGHVVVKNSQQLTTISAGVINTNSIVLGKEPTSPSNAATKKYVDDSVSSVVPSGVIVMWSGTANAIPDGWALCNGSNGTPDLQNRFVVGAGSTYAAGATGGEATHTLVIEELPSHRHSEYLEVSQTGQTIYRTHSDNGTNVSRSGISIKRDALDSADSATLSTSNIQTGSAGSSLAHNNLPPYYALCYIMKL